MKLRAVDIDKIVADSSPVPTNVRSAEDYQAANVQTREALVQQLIAHKNQSHARSGEILPPAPSSNAERRRAQAEADEIAEAAPIKAVAATITPIPAALSGCDLRNIESRADLLRELTLRLPINDFGLPRWIYRGDLLDINIFTDRGYAEGSLALAAQYVEMQNYLDVALIHLDYSQGFPVLPDGQPLWARLTNEPLERFQAFTDYTTQPGTRALHKLTTLPPPSKPLETLIAWFHEDYWTIRAKCYDLSHAVFQAKIREQRILGCEDKHYLIAERLVAKLTILEESIEWDLLKNEPEKYVKVMQTAINLQRQALGLLTTTTGRQNDGGTTARTESIEMIMRRATAPEVKMVRDQRAEDPAQQVSVRSLLKNPEALASAQELIIRMSQTTITSPPELPDNFDEA